MEGVTLKSHPFEVVAEGQMRKNAAPKECHPLVMFLLKHEIPLSSGLYRFAFSLQSIINKIKTFL